MDNLSCPVGCGPPSPYRNWRFGVVLGFTNIPKSLDILDVGPVAGTRLMWFYFKLF